MTRRPPQGAMEAVQRAVTPAEEAAFATLEAEVGGRQALVSNLATAQLPKDIEQVLGMIADPLHDHESLARICALGRVSLGKLLKVFQESMRTRAQVLAHTRIAKSLPDVAAGVMSDATPGWRDCLDCMGAQQIEVDKPDVDENGVPVKPARTHRELVSCPGCRGRGLVYHHPDHEVQKTALKIGGILEMGKGGGVNLAVLQANTQGNPGDTGSYDRMMEALDGMIYGTGRDRMRRSDGVGESGAVEGEVTDAE